MSTGSEALREVQPLACISLLMGKNTRKQRLALFDLYAADFALATKDIFHVEPAPPEGLCVCPICRTGYFRDSVAAMEPETEPTMDLAHVWPESCEGTEYTLTCKKCNSRIGSRYDSQIAQDYKVVAAFSGTGEQLLDAEMYYEGGRVAVEMRRHDKGFDFKEIAARTNQSQKIKFEDYTKTVGIESIKFKLVWKHPDERRHSVAILHSAYLAMFRHFGYEYYALGNCHWIRDILVSNDPPEEGPYLSIQLDAADHNPMYSLLERFRPYVMRIEPGHFCMAVPMPSPMPNVVARLVILPGIGPEAVEDYNSIVSKHQPDVPITFTLTVDRRKWPPPERRIGNPKRRLFGLWWWRDQVKGFYERI